ncbi:GNAT family N-acetyltransferase [Methylocystis sp. ATCC 49242]|uniref:GNAT family N-acetyltransferase n=1 Tax=Methylocystis sp. ATCC 49242 TaxID=622637 RepID=UPI0001F87FDE|nr:GNAT family N-acetyltransferase [Methylocystis sp. ATCC 49242]
MTKNPPIEKPTLEIETGESAEVAARLGAEVAARFGPRDEAPLSIVARDASGALIGGLNGVSHWRWLYVRHLWVSDAQRGRGLGGRLMEEAGRAALARGCIGVYIDTFDPRVADFYERAGFSRVGEIADFPPGGQRIFLSRRLR